MVNRSIVSIFDKLSVQTILTGQTGSIFGFIGTLAFIVVCLILLIPPIYLYNIGSYFESQFLTDQYPQASYTTGTDLVLAASFRNRKTNEYANHTKIIQNLASFVTYKGQLAKHKIDFIPCQPQLFKKGINPISIKDCLMIPKGLIFDIEAINGFFPYLSISFNVKCEDVFQCGDNNPLKAQRTQFMTQLNKNFYYEFIFSSKIIDDKGEPTLQFHKVYSSQYNSIDSNNQILIVKNGQRQTFIDNSIMPWWNNKTNIGIFWSGKLQGKDIFDNAVVALGFYIDFLIDIQYRYAFRYYKKLDFIIGMIGGAIFLLYIIFWIPFSYINRTLQKIQYSQEFFINYDDQFQNIKHLKKINISLTFLFENLLPWKTKSKDIVSLSQNQINLVTLIKKLKVTQRNLKTNKITLDYKTKDIDFSSEQKPLQNNTEQQNLLDISPSTYQALKKASNSQKIYSTQPALLAIKQSNMLSAAVEDDRLQKNRNSSHNYTFKQKFLYYLSEIFKFFDIFGARPMFIAQPQNSSCWGFFLTIIILILSILTVALTIYNMNTVKIITTYKYQKPQDHQYEMVTSKNLRLAFCIAGITINTHLQGASKTTQLSFFKYSKTNGFQDIGYERMVAGEFLNYFQLDAKDPYVASASENCFKPARGVTVPFGGTYNTQNQAYFGVRLDPYCMGTPSECLSRKNQIITKFLSMINYNSFGIYINQNKYSPKKNKLIPGMTGQFLSQSNTVLNGSLKRTQTIYISSIELIEDQSKSFLREQPKIIQKTASIYQSGENNQQRKGDPSSDPAYILQFRPNGQVKQVILRTYKIDFLFGIIGGSFLFWYFIINLFAKIYNSFKFRAKMAQTLYQQDSYDSSILVCFLHLIRMPPKILCCSQIKQDIVRMRKVDQKIKRDLNLVNLVKKTDNCYYLSSSLFHTIQQRNLSLIYFRQKIDQSQIIKPKRSQQEKEDNFSDDQFGSLDDQIQNTKLQQTRNKIVNQNQANQKNNTFKDLQKIVISNGSNQSQQLYDPDLQIKQQNPAISIVKKLDLFKTSPELTLDGKRDVKSIIGGICFFIDIILIVIVVSHFIGLYLSGADFTMSHRLFRDQNLSQIDATNTLGQLQIGIKLQTGKNFKFAAAFHIKDHYYPFDVSSYIKGPIGIRMLQFTVKTVQNGFNQTYQQFQLQPCRSDYALDFLSEYNDRAIYGNLTNAYCIPDGISLTLKGVPQDLQKKYFKLNIYNKFKNQTGIDALLNFFKLYIPRNYMSIPRLDLSREKFNYQMTSFNFIHDRSAKAYQHNLTLTKIKFTDKYKGTSRQSYNDKKNKVEVREDINTLTTQYTRNVTFYYTGMIDQYTLDYPRGGELFGLLGGVIALFTYLLYGWVMSFNQFRMKYMIGQRLYTLDKKASGIYKDLSANKNKKKKQTNKQKILKMRQKTHQINNFNQLQLLLAWFLSPFAYIKDNYNNPSTLRYVTLIVQRVQQDINLFNFYKKLQTVNDALNKRINLESNNNLQQNFEKIKLSTVYFKKLYHQERIQRNVPSFSNLSKKHKLSSFEQINIEKALIAKINPEQVIGNRILNNFFGHGDNTSILQSRYSRQIQQDIIQPNSNTIIMSHQNQSFTNLNQRFGNEETVSKIRQSKKIEEDKNEDIISNFDIQ